MDTVGSNKPFLCTKIPLENESSDPVPDPKLHLLNDIIVASYNGVVYFIEDLRYELVKSVEGSLLCVVIKEAII